MASHDEADSGEWATVVPPRDFDRADALWANWVERNGRPTDDDMRTDTFTSSTVEDRRRYLVRKGSTADRETPSALADQGVSSAGVAAAALAIGWQPLEVMQFLRTHMDVPLGEAKVLVVEMLPEEVQLAQALSLIHI